MGIHHSFGNDMLILITYDVDTTDRFGQKRLRKVAKICQSKGQRVQNSVFECSLDNSQLLVLKSQLLEIINPEKDSLRIYNLGNSKNKVEHYGAKATYNPDDFLML